MAHLPSAMPARTSYEQAILTIWGDVLGSSGFGVNDDFFELGGHSLLAPKVVSRIRRTLGVQIPVIDFFRTPTVAALADAVARQAAGSEATAAADRITEPASDPATDPATDPADAKRTVRRRPPDAEPVLSFDQQRLWLEDQVLPGAAYNVHGRRRLTGGLDPAALHASLRTVVARHEALRTRFPVVDGQPRQIVDDPDDGWLPDVEDLGALPEPDRLPAARRLADAQASAPFDLAAGPLFRCLVIRLSDTDHVLSVTMHHIVSDAWSVGLLVRELTALYEAGGDAARAGLPDLPVQYRDYAVWQRSRLTGETLDREIAFWRRHLDGAPPALTLPAAHRNAAARRAGGRVASGLSAPRTAALHEMCRKHGASPFMALFAAYATVLARWSGQRDLVIGVPIAGRGDTGTDAVIGFFVNTLPVRISLAGDPTFAELLGRVRTVCLEAYTHAEAPVDVIVERLQVARDPRRTPLFEVLLNTIGSPETERISGIAVAPMAAPALPSKYELVLNAQETDGALELGLDYNADSFDPPMVRALVDQLVALLRAAVDDPDKDVLDYELRPAGDAGPDAGPPVEAAGQDGQDGRAGQVDQADRVAVIDADRAWTHAQLAIAAERFARRVGDAEHVGIVRRSSAAFVAAVLGCVRAGVRYSVIEADTEVPLSYLGITTVLDVADEAADDTDTDTTIAATATSATTTAEPTANRSDPAATGLAPAGAWAVTGHGLSAEDRIAPLTTSPGLLIAALAGAAASGATLVLPPQDRDDGDRIGRWLREAAVTCVYLGPEQLRALSGPLPDLRLAFVENRGDLLAHDVETLRRLAPDGRLVGVYRAGRDGRPLAAYEVPPDWPAATAPLRVPLGTELPGAPARLRHPAGQPAAVGEVAELCFGEYRTGDLARRWSQGTLEFVAAVGADRTCDPAETAAALRDLPDVRDALVLEYADADGEPALAGYLAGPEPDRDGAALRRALILRLPERLVPRQLFVLDTLPRTADGSYDLNALPSPEDQDEADGYAAPRTPLEHDLTDIFQRLLGVDRVGVHDTFFELNGFSLLATSLVSRIRERFDVELPLREVFASPTVAGLAQVVLVAIGEQSADVELEALLTEIEAGR